MNRDKAIRFKFYELLSGADILYDSGEISIWDEKAEDTTNNLYILFRDQTANIFQTGCNDTWDCTIELAIVNKQQDTITKSTTDDIAEQVEALLAPLWAGATYEGWQILNCVLSSSNYSGLILEDTVTTIEKTLIFSLTAIKLT